ncbi:MAG: transposase, partial [Candidatus Diapherotrites archaeon]|nr:transposase [Candidatus Diapherotrites archaeon]
RKVKTTTASLHDAKISLITKADWKMYRDKGYFGTTLPQSVFDKTMDRATRGHPLTESQKERNHQISRIRCQGERPFGVIKRTFNGAFTHVKTLSRVSIKEMFKCFAFDLYHLVTLEKKRLA